MPRAANRWRHRPTVFGRTPSSRDTSSLRLPLKASQNDLGTLDQAGFLGTAPGKVHQLSSLFGRTRQRYRDPGHETPHVVRGSWYHTIYRVSTQLSTSLLQIRAPNPLRPRGCYLGV